MLSSRKTYLKRGYLLFFVFSFLSFFSQEKSSDIRTINNRKYYVHKVEKGQSLYAISKTYNTDVNTILAENEEAKNGIKPGQELKIPFDLKSAEVKPVTIAPVITQDTGRYIYHKVLKKETIYSICKQYDITDKQLESFNPGVASGIHPDQILIVGEKKTRREKILANQVNFNSPAPVALSDTSLGKPKAKKNKYNIGLILPFKTADVDLIDPALLVQSKSNFPQIVSWSVDFLLGFNKALDSIKSEDCKIETFIFDVDDKDSAKLETICRSDEFKSLDLIIGPVYPSGFRTVSGYAKQNSIPLISPFTQQNKILFKNNLASKTNPSQFTLMESLADYCMDSLKANSAIYIVNNGMAKETQYVKAFKNYYNDKIKSKGFSTKDSIIEVRGLSGAKEKYIPGKKNVYLLFSNNQVYLADFITQLAVWSDKKDITLAGWQNITQMDNIDQDYLNRLSYTFPSQNNISNIKSYSHLISGYQTEMSSDPSDYYFMGFDIAQYYISNLKKEGPAFMNKLDQYPGEGNFLRFKFYRPDEATGYENKGVFVFRYKDFQLYRSLWK